MPEGGEAVASDLGQLGLPLGQVATRLQGHPEDGEGHGDRVLARAIRPPAVCSPGCLPSPDPPQLLLSRPPSWAPNQAFLLFLPSSFPPSSFF